MPTVPRSVYVLLFSAVFVISVFYAYFLNEDARLLEKKIESAQRDYAEVLQLRDAYESQKRAFEKAVSKKVENRGISLGVVEEMAAKSFTGGTLAALQPVNAREGKGGQRMSVDVKVTGAALGEVISFARTCRQSRSLRRQAAALSAGGKPRRPRHASNRQGEAFEWVAVTGVSAPSHTLVRGRQRSVIAEALQ